MLLRYLASASSWVREVYKAQMMVLDQLIANLYFNVRDNWPLAIVILNPTPIVIDAALSHLNIKEAGADQVRVKGSVPLSLDKLFSSVSVMEIQRIIVFRN